MAQNVHNRCKFSCEFVDAQLIGCTITTLEMVQERHSTNVRVRFEIAWMAEIVSPPADERTDHQ